MSLATRCTACGTVFRVVQDQLKVSEGWVRCGRCNEVFNALEGLFDLEREGPPDWEPARPLQPPAAAEIGSDGFVIDRAVQASDEPASAATIDAPGLDPRHSENGSTPASRVEERDGLDFPDAQFDPELLNEGSSGAEARAVQETPAAQGPSDQAAAPEFLRPAHLQPRWQTPRVRGALVLASVILLMALALQGMHQFRDSLAAGWPAAKPAMLAWCVAMACKIEPPRRIEDISVESTTLTRAAVADAFRLSVALRNRGTMAVALPSVDLSLTDAAGQLVARRVLAPREFRATSSIMLPGSESALQLVLTAGAARVTGYTVEVFYP